MPQGKGTYGSTRGRPPKAKRMSKIKSMLKGKKKTKKKAYWLLKRNPQSTLRVTIRNQPCVRTCLIV